MDNSSDQKFKTAVTIGVALLILLLIGGSVWVISSVMASKSTKPARMVQNITVIRPPPPPPPEDKPPPPPPEKVEQQIPQNEPDPTPDNAPPTSAQLGLDADGAAGDDGFGLAARKGGSDLLGTGGAAFAWYTSKLKEEIVDRLSSDAHVHEKKFSVSVRVWIDTDGRIKQVHLVSTTGNRDLDNAISKALSSLTRLSEAPPIEMPQPISLQIVSRA